MGIITHGRRRLAWLGLFAILLQPGSSATADTPAIVVERHYLEVSPTNLGDLDRLLGALETSLQEASLQEASARQEPVIVVLHGDEARSFTRQAYTDNRVLVDRAAVLHAHRMLELRMCETWMRHNGVEPTDLLPFVDTVPYAPEEIRRLQGLDYTVHPSVEL